MTKSGHIFSRRCRRRIVRCCLKAVDQIEWIRRMNSIRNRAEEIVLNELVYCWKIIITMDVLTDGTIREIWYSKRGQGWQANLPSLAFFMCFFRIRANQTMGSGRTNQWSLHTLTIAPERSSNKWVLKFWRLQRFGGYLPRNNTWFRRKIKPFCERLT